MSGRPSMTKIWKIARNRQTVIEQLVDGLVMGAMLGPGIIIVGRDADRIEFKKNQGLLKSVLKRGEILISDDETGETKIECRIWYQVYPRQLSGVPLATLALCLIFLEQHPELRAIVPALVLLAMIFAGRAVKRARMKQQLEAYLHNLIYLRAM